MDRPPDMQGLTPAERAALYKQRARAAGAGGAGQTPAATEGAGAASPEAGQAPTTPAAGPPAPPQAAPPPAPAANAPAAVPPAPSAPPRPATAAPAAAPAAPVAKAPVASAPTEPEAPAVPGCVQAVLDAVPGATWQWRHGYAEMAIARERLLEAAWQLRDSGFDYLSFITEVDWSDRFELVYHIFSYDYERQPLGAILRLELPRDGVPEVASLTPVWPGAEYMERESAEMMGIRFLGHPDLRRILLPDDFVGYPMRKDYETDWEYITVKQLVRELEGPNGL